eukprot:c5073_g1_i1 orf=3-272(-)
MPQGHHKPVNNHSDPLLHLTRGEMSTSFPNHNLASSYKCRISHQSLISGTLHGQSPKTLFQVLYMYRQSQAMKLCNIDASNYTLMAASAS